MDREAAQARLDRIGQFRAELDALEHDGVVILDAAGRRAIADYHQRAIAELTSHFDLDRGEQQRRMSLGMRIAALIGAVALSAAIFLFFERIWGDLSTVAQVVILVAAPVVGLLLTETAHRLDRTRHLVFVAAVIACACMVLNVTMLGDIFAMTDSPNAFLVWAAFAIAVGYGYELRTPVAVGLACAIVFGAGFVFDALRFDWKAIFERPETFIPVAVAVAGLGVGASKLVRRRYAPSFRLVGLVVTLGAIWALMFNGHISLLPIGEHAVMTFYQITGFVVAAAGTAIGLRATWAETTYTGAAAVVVFLYTKFYQWWWDWMPAYLFFFVVGATAVAMILALRRVRTLAVPA